MDLFEIMDDTKEIPLYIDLAFGSKSKSIQTNDWPDMSKGRLTNG